MADNEPRKDTEFDLRQYDTPLEKKDRGGLGVAHRGYVYQDVATAYFLAKALVNADDCVVVDRKEYEGDLFDDLTIEHGGRRCRRQFKSSADVDKEFTAEVLKTTTKDLRIDDIVHCFLSAADNPADEYRICSTWSVPTDADTARLLSACDADPSFDGYPTRLFRLNVDEIWPDGGTLKWNLRRQRPFDRQALTSFCERLIIELECPQITLDLTAPGPLQALLRDLLSARIGVGRFPNQEISPTGAANTLTYRASLARARHETVIPAQVLRDLGLRTDFGRVAQKFPVIPDHFVSRRQALVTLLARVNSAPLVGLVGPPGSGKSWILTPFAKYCAEAGFLVTRHYCYLEPGDELREKRITSNVFFGNLIADIYDVLPSLECPDAPKYSAGPDELVKLLNAVRRSNPQQRLVLIVDGLDHIDRVLSEARGVPQAETRIVDELASLDLPDGVSIVIGSQPGNHLAPLCERAAFVDVPHWNRDEIRRLAAKLGTLHRIREFCDREAMTRFLDELHARSEGNPLYATYLCRETETAIASGQAGSPAELVQRAPQQNGDLNNYYRYLVGPGVPDTVSSVLAYIDFAVTRSELAELEPAVEPQLPTLLAKLRPILTDVSRQGGLRIYHESFRRFIVGQVTQHRGHRDHVLRGISTWLETRGFPRDSRSYRYLLAYLFKQAAYRAVLERVGVDFVSRGVENGYSAEAILDNLGIAVDAARATNDWPALCRIAELRKSVYACFEAEMNFAEYTRANLAVNGAQTVAEQLLFDGKPTRSKDEGLIACSLCDDAGISPPWHEYLNLPGGRDLNDREQAALADFQGVARTTPWERLRVSIASWLRQGDEPPQWYVRGILSRLANVMGVEALDLLIAEENLPVWAVYNLHLSAAGASKQAGDTPLAGRHATEGASMARDVRDAHECVLLGAPQQDMARFCTGIEELTQRLLQTGHVTDDNNTKDWISAVGLLAFVDLERLEAIRSSITIQGWYTAWMRFAISVATATCESSSDSSSGERTVLSGLRALATEKDPFRGTPRACDLYSIRDSIHAVWKDALALILTAEGLSEALALLSEISASTTTSVQGSSGGPLTMDALADLAETLVSRAAVGRAAIGVVESQVQTTERGFYGTQAGLEMRLAVAYAAVADPRAAERWTRACQCLTAYGYRKDITIFEVINSISCLRSHDLERTKECLKDLQPLVASLDWRTDGKDTRGAVMHWYESLLATTPAQAVIVLARSLLEDGGEISWRFEACLEDLTKAATGGAADILFALSNTSPPSAERTYLESQLLLIEQIIALDQEQGTLAFQQFLARLDRLAGKLKRLEFDLLSSFAISRDLAAPPVSLRESEGSSERGEEPLALPGLEHQEADAREPMFSDDVPLLQVMRILRGRDYRTRMTDDIVRALGDRLVRLGQENRIDDAVWLLTSFASEVYLDSRAEILAGVAASVLQHNQPRTAAVAYALAGWSFGRGTVWFTGFHEQHLGYLRAARQLDANAFDQTIADRVVASIKHADGYTIGNACRLIHIAAFLIDAESAFACWRATFDVIRHRMPEWQSTAYAMSTFEPSQDDTWTLDEALCFLLLCRVSHPDMERKRAAIAGLAELISRCPTRLTRALTDALSRDTPLTSVLLILSTMLCAESPPYLCTQSIAEILRSVANTDLFAVRMLAERLLTRIDTTAGL